MKKWQVENTKKIENEQDLIKTLLENRNIKTKSETKDFLNPDLSKITASFVKIDKNELQKAIERIKKAISKKQKIIVFGDYDVDGVCASAILWETLNDLKVDVMPFIPSRFEEGYGLSKQGIDNLLLKQKVDLIITVDNGIVADDAVEYANKKGIDVIITDHHVPSENLPKALAIIHTTYLCGTGVAYILSKELKIEQDDHLALVALATVSDLVPLTGANRILLYSGLKALRNTRRVGLLSLIQKSGIKASDIGVYEIGHVLAPRLNAMGRLESAMDSLRLICTKDKKRADKLAVLLSETNLQRQQITFEALKHAKSKVEEKEIKNLIFIASENYQQGIVGLVAGRLVEEYYFPSIVISKGKKFSKASARSIKGFNIIEFLRGASDLLVDVGGHPMAAGFTVETSKLELLEKKLFESASKLLKKEHLERILRIDLNLPQNLMNLETYLQIQKLAPFGMANPEPTFLTENLIVESMKLVGNDGKHLKLSLKTKTSNLRFEGIAFGMGEGNGFKIGDSVDVVYTLDENEWNRNKNLQLKIKDMKKN
jgi:single-stranded-DNA-specific exonuclease